MIFFKFQQLPFYIRTATVSYQLSVRADDPVAGNKPGNSDSCCLPLPPREQPLGFRQQWRSTETPLAQHDRMDYFVRMLGSFF
jgi:hypothetical protein